MNLQKLYSWIKVSFNFNFKTNVKISDTETVVRENIWLEWFGLYRRISYFESSINHSESSIRIIYSLIG